MALLLVSITMSFTTQQNSEEQGDLDSINTGIITVKDLMGHSFSDRTGAEISIFPRAPSPKARGRGGLQAPCAVVSERAEASSPPRTRASFAPSVMQGALRQLNGYTFNMD